MEDASREYGKICGVGSFNDMTELTRAQEELLALKQRLEFILGATRTGLDIIDSNFNMVYIDPEWAKTYGDPQGRKCYEYFMGRGEVCPGCGIAKALRTKQPVVTEEILARENNRPVQVTTIPFQNEKGEWLVAEVNADITERKRAEEHIRKLNEVQAALHDPGALREKLKRITDGVVDIFDADFARIWLTRPGDLCESGCMHAEVTEGPHVCRSRDRCLHLLASSGRYTHLDGKGHRRVPFGCYKIGRIASGQDAAFLTNDVAGDPRVHNHEWARALGLVSFAGYQLRPPHGETIGVLALFSKRPISSEEDALLKSLSNLIVPVIQATQADDALRKSEHTYRTLLENLPQKIFLKDANSVYVSCNENYARDLGINADEIAGKTDYDFHPVELAEKYRADDKRTMELGNPEELEEPYVQDGQRKWVHTLKTPVRDESGKVMGILGIFWDITEKKNLEEQLRQAQKMEAVGRLAGGVAHDFNNLLTVIGGNAELAAMTPLLPEEAGRHLTGIMQASERAADLTRQLLAFSRRQTLAPRVVSLNDVLSNMDKMLRRLIGEDIELVTLLAKDLWAVRVDISQMEQVIANLAVNARDAMPHGGKLTLETANAHLDAEYARLYPDATPGEYVMLAIRDTGCGMTHEVKAHIFEPFFTTKEVGKGTGLGLSTCYGMVKQSGGHIWVYSDLGHGATFKIFLPRVRQEPGALPQRQDTAELPIRGSETVLVAEDDPLVRSVLLSYRIYEVCEDFFLSMAIMSFDSTTYSRIFPEAFFSQESKVQGLKSVWLRLRCSRTCRILRDHGYTVLEAANGEEALRIVRQKPAGTIHLLLSDVIMPQMSGKDLAERVKKARSDIKVLFVSGYTDTALRRKGVPQSDAVLLQKPFTSSALARKVREALDS